MTKPRSRSAKYPSLRMAMLAVAVAAAVFPALADIPANDGDPMVRIAYVIPSNRSPQPDGVSQIQEAIMMVHEWYGEQMARWGYGYKTFRYETESDGVTPKVWVIQTTMPDYVMRDGLWARAKEAAYAAGATSIYNDTEIWVFFPETHLMLEDSSIIGGACWGGGAALHEDGAPGIGNGWAMVGTDALPIFGLAMCQDDRTYDGHIILEIGPYPLVQDVTWAWFLGNTFSSVCSSYTGGLAHEMGHGFGLAHDWRYDGNFQGNLMYNGLRGYRGWRFPNDYSDDFVRLNYASGLFIGVNPYFTIYRDGQPAPYESDDITLPTLQNLTPTVVTPVNGQIEIAFEAWDDVGLAAARLRMPWDTVAEIPLERTHVTATIRTPYYGTPWFGMDEQHRYLLTVYDTSGNTMTEDIRFTLGTADNRAPRPHLRTTPRSEAWVDEPVILDASDVEDPDDAYRDLQVEWDLDGDGQYDTAPSTEKIHVTSYATPGIKCIGMRVTDPHGASSTSYPLALRVVADCNENGVADYREILDGDSADENGNWVPDECEQIGDLDGDGCVGHADLGILLSDWMCDSGDCPGDCDGDGDTDHADLGILLAHWGEGCP